MKTKHSRLIILIAFWALGSLSPASARALTLGNPSETPSRVAPSAPAKKPTTKPPVEPIKPAPRAAEERESIPRLSIGVVYTGGLLRGRLGNHWGLEGRYQTGSSSSDGGDVTADVLGGRIYWFSNSHRRFTFYAGGEGASLTIDNPSAADSIHGWAAGGFIGLEYRLGQRLSWGMDAGVYHLSLEEAAFGVKDAGSDFVINSHLNFHLF